MEDAILSVGIDIGTSTTSMVVSRLVISNVASCFTVPHVAITDKEVIYRSDTYETPQERGNRIDADAVAHIVESEYGRANLTPDLIQTGAVIITGESSRKENARLVTEKLSTFAGEFVVASAGADLESVIAGKGAGAQDYSQQQACTVANLDVGGGTSNIAIFHSGQLTARGCYDIGGRLIKVREGVVTYISKRIAHIIDETKAEIEVGKMAQVSELRKVTDRMADILGECLGFCKETPACQISKTAESSPLVKPQRIDAVTFSGGVADYVYHPSADWFLFGDIGLLLAASLRCSSWLEKTTLLTSAETIQATVIGAGSHTTSVSGSTIAFSDEALFPLKNVPVFAASEAEERELLSGNGSAYCEKAVWFRRESSTDNLVFALSHIQQPSYEQILCLTKAMLPVAESLPEGQPLLVVCREDFAKVLGMALTRELGAQRKIVCLDSIYTVSGDYMDFGRPLMEGLVVPVVVKTLIFG